MDAILTNLKLSNADMKPLLTCLVDVQNLQQQVRTFQLIKLSDDLHTHASRGSPVTKVPQLVARWSVFGEYFHRLLSWVCLGRLKLDLQRCSHPKALGSSSPSSWAFSPVTNIAFRCLRKSPTVRPCMTSSSLHLWHCFPGFSTPQ